MIFSGFEVFPVGKAKLEIKGETLKVSNISESGLDGVLVDTKGLLNYTIDFDQLSAIADNKGMLKTSTLSKNKLGQVTTTFESFKQCDKNGENIIIGYNRKLIPENFSVFGELKGKEVFCIDSSEIKPIEIESSKLDPATAAIIIGIIKIGIEIWKLLRSKKTSQVKVEYDADGNVTGMTVTYTEDPVPFEVEVNRKKYTIDNFGIKYNQKVPKERIGLPDSVFTPIAEQITGVNIPEFTITSIHKS